MRVACITDIHFGVRGDSVNFLDYYEKFYRDTFFPKLKKEGITTLLILGDTFETRKTINFNTLHRTKKMFFDVLKDMDIKVHMLVGNHDAHFKNILEVNSIELLLSEYLNINAISKPTTINVDGIPICMIPWICQDNEEYSLAEMKNTKAKYCMGHFEIAGFAMHRGMESEEGLTQASFQKFSAVFSGHYHHKSSKGNITYLGNPAQTTWSDYGDVRGFHIFDLKSEQLDFVKNPNTMFHKIVYDDAKTTLQELSLVDVSQYTGTYVKVLVEAKNNPVAFDQFLSRLYGVNPLDVALVEDGIDLTEVLEDDIIDEAEDTVFIISKFIDAMIVDGIDNSRAKSNMRELYMEALQQEKS